MHGDRRSADRILVKQIFTKPVSFFPSSTYDADFLLAEFSPVLCPDHFPEGQDCALPLLPGVYGGGEPLVIGPIESVPDLLLPFLQGTIYAEAHVANAAGDELVCIWVRAAIDH
jgi:hypothetical protein